ncbi:hypothetical protein QUF76_10365 [Desulfobacterales bacterium HSG16]|nr:hypothetical protein [Desulfobacterales bacterium HSG16]
MTNLKKIVRFCLTLLFLTYFCGCVSLDGLLEKGKYPEAENFCARQPAEKQAQCHTRVANAYLGVQNWAKAAIIFEALKNDKGLKAAADGLFSQKKYTDAERIYGKIDDRQGLLSVAEALLAEKNFTKSEALFKKLDNKQGLLSVADAYVKNKDYSNAERLYKSLENKPGLKIIGDAYVLKNDIDAAASCYLKSEEKILLEENFNDNLQQWFERDTESVVNSVSDGKYIFENKGKKQGFFSWPKKIVRIDPAQDFTITADFEIISGTEEGSCNIVWGFKDPENCHAFGVRNSGEYVLGRFEKGKWISTIDWTRSSYIKKYNPQNKESNSESKDAVIRDDQNNNAIKNRLSIKRSGDTIRLYINGQYVNKARIAKFERANIGLAVFDRMKTVIDHVSIRQSFYIKEIYQTIFQKQMEAGDYNSIIAHYKKGGYTSNQAFVKIAQSCMDRKDYISAKEYLEKSGWPKDRKEAVVIFEDNFDYNKNSWFEEENSEFIKKIADKKYTFELKRRKKGEFTWPESIINIDQGGDFLIETNVRMVSGTDNSIFNLVWGLVDIKNCIEFSMSMKGYYQYGAYEDGEWKVAIDWTKSSFIKKTGQNTISVVKSGDKIKFYINGRFVDKASYENFSGNRIGFSLDTPMHVEIDSISIIQLPPEAALQLAANDFEQTNNRNGLKALCDINLLKKDYDEAKKFYKQSIDGLLSQTKEEQKLLAFSAEHNPDPKLQIDAIGKIWDQNVLKKIAIGNKGLEIKKAAIERLENQAIIADIAIEENILPEIQIFAVSRLNSQNLLARIAQNSKTYEVRYAAFKKIRNKNILTRIISANSNAKVRMEAVAHIGDYKELVIIATNDDDFDIREKALERLGAVFRMTADRTMLKTAIDDENLPEPYREIAVEQLRSRF